jgi:hypothetical protein
MVILDADFGRPVFSPAEDDPPLIVNADGVESAETALQGFKPVSRRHSHIAELSSPVKLDKFSQGHTEDGCVPAVPLLMEELLGIAICK